MKPYREYRVTLSALLGVRPGQKNSVYIAHDPSGDFRNCCFDVSQISYDLAGEVYSPGTVFERDNRRVVWDGLELVSA